MSRQVEKDVISIVADVSGFEEEEISLETNFVKDLEVDSIKTIEITVAIEKKFRVSVRDDEVPKITTVRHAVELVTKLLSSGAVNAQAK